MQFIEVNTDFGRRLLNIGQISEVKELLKFPDTCEISYLGYPNLVVLHTYEEVKEMILKPKFQQ